MPFEIPVLPYSLDALSPTMSPETLECHYGKHHQGYANALNKLVGDTELAHCTLEELIINIKTGDIFNNAAQIWNHTFFWNCLTPNGGGKPLGKVADQIERQFGGFANFRDQFATTAVSHFGSGWIWLTRLANGALSVETTKNADCPLVHGHKPLLTLDVWEHAYYLDYRHDRSRYVYGFWDLVDWDFVNEQLG